MMVNKIKTIAFHTLGCKLNYAETSSISRQFEEAGFDKVDFHASADLYVINTCSVTENADKEFRKIVNRAKRRSPHARIAVIGCYAQLRPEVIAESSAVDIVLGTREKFNILNHIHFDSLKHKQIIVQDTKLEELHSCIPAYSLGDRTRSFLKIQDGCDYICTYCTIPRARGISRSLDPKLIINQALELAEKGVKEIVLTGVNVGDYHYTGTTTLLDLLKSLDQVPGIQRIRISSIEPNLLTDDMIRFISDSKRILPHIHLPLQSGSDKILSLMKRRYNAEFFKDRVQALNEIIPHAGIGVDVIVGFPGEGENEFQQTRSLLESLDISYLHVFTYSERPDTPAINYVDKVPLSERKIRNRALTQISSQKQETFALKQLNQIHQVLIETSGNGMLTGMTENYLKVFMEGEDPDMVNSIVNVELVALKEQKLMGVII